MDDLGDVIFTALAEFRWELAAAIFIAYIAIDALAAFYTLMVTRLKASRAAVADFFIYLLISFGVINYTRNFLYVLPMAVGGALGTFLVVRWHRKRNRKIPKIHGHKRKRIR